jgi:hypothetical protein
MTHFVIAAIVAHALVVSWRASGTAEGLPVPIRAPN